MTDSIWYYKGPGEFKHLIRTQADKSILVSDMVAEWREAIVLPKKLGSLTVQQVSDDTKLMAQVREALQKMPAESKYKLPYDKEQRQQEIIDNIAEIFPIDKKNTQCKIITGCYKDDKTGQQFPFAVELAIAPRKDLGVKNAGEVTFIGCVNDTPGIDGGERRRKVLPKWPKRV